MERSYSAFWSSSGALQFGVPTSDESTFSAATEAEDRAWAATDEARRRRVVASAGPAAAMVSVSRLWPKSPTCR